LLEFGFGKVGVLFRRLQVLEVLGLGGVALEHADGVAGAEGIWRHTAGMKFRVVLEYDPEAESYSAVCPELPGCASAGETEEEARRGIEEAIRLYLSPAEIGLSPTR
jgi:predicted RNase H-like HicB family nuclease